MSKQVLISMLRQGNTGNEILSILDVIANDAISEGDDDTQTGNVPTLEMIDFWPVRYTEGQSTPLLSISNSAQIPVVVRVLAGRGRRIYKKGSYLIYKVLLRAAKYIPMGPLLGSPLYQNFFRG